MLTQPLDRPRQVLDYEKLPQLHSAYMRSLYRPVGESSASEVVAVANVQLFEMDP